MKVRLALAVVLLSAAACADEPKKQLAPTAPPPSKSATIAAPVTVHASTVCLSYARDLALARAELKDRPSSERLQKKVASMNQLFQDACQ